MPVTFLGTGIGLLPTVTGPGVVLDDRAREVLGTIASPAGVHVGSLRAVARSRADAEHDALTGLLNRRGPERAVARLETQRAACVVVVADLDHVKAIKDTNGHDAGDAVLVAAARSMTAALRPGDVLARHGGEEFVVVLPVPGDVEGSTGAGLGVLAAERLRSAVAAAGPPSCTASFGVAGPLGTGLDDTLRAADAALYRARAGGRDRVELAGGVVPTLPRQLLQA